MSGKLEMAGTYQVIHALRFGGATLVIGYDPTNTELPYMTSYREQDFPGAYRYPKAVASGDYRVVVKRYAERLQRQIRLMERAQKTRTMPRLTLSRKQCLSGGLRSDFTGKLIIIRPDSLAPEYRSADYQVGYAVGGPGCTPADDSDTVIFRELFSGKRSEWRRGDVLGLADPKKLPKWARKLLAERGKKPVSVRK